MWDKNNDKHFRDKARAYRAADWDKEALWSKIEAELPPDNRNRRAGLWWWLTGCFLILSISMAAFMTGAMPPEPAALSAYDSATVNSAEQKLEQKNTPNTGESTTENSVLATISQTAVAVSSSVPALPETVQLSDTETVLSTAAQAGTSAPEQSPLSQLSGETPTANESKLPSLQLSEYSETYTKLSPLSLLPKSNFVLLEEQENFNFSEGLTKPLKKAAKFRVEAFAGVGLAFRSLEADSPEFENYAQQRKDSERTLEVLSTGVRFQVVNAQGFKLETGLSLNRLTEEFTFRQQDISTTQVALDSAYYVQGFAGTSFFADTVDAEQTRLRSVKNFNTHTFLEVPILVGYEKRFGRLQAGLSLGASLGVNHSFKGKLSDAESKITDDLPSNYFNTGLRLSGLAELNLAYLLPRNFELSLTGALQTGSGSLTNTGLTGIRQQYSFLSLRVGVRKTFGR